ncbi:MAG: phage terminase large subunit [Balneolaceae bacterium]|nr:phage terminase large subunit [Balneolaceae bacterium]
MKTEIQLSDFQKQVCAIPEKYDLFLGGGRGGAKSFTMAILALRHCEQYKEKARVLFVRQTYKGLSDFESLTREIFGQLYRKSASYNQTEHVWRMPNGGYIELGQLESPKDYDKYQGRSFTLLLIDEAGQYSTPELLDRLRSNLRGAKDMPIRIVTAANPGGVGHHWIAQRYVFKSEPWRPYNEKYSGRKCVYAPSTFLDNEFIDQDEYKKQLQASCPSDPELLRAWLEGDWAVARGAFFASVIEESRNAIAPIEKIPIIKGRWNEPDEKWEHWLAHDYGSSAPSATYVMLRSPGAEINDVYYPKDSILIIDELVTADPVALNEGLGYTIPHLSEYIKEMSNKWDIKPKGVADDAIFSKHGHSGGSISTEFSRCGVYFKRAKKGDRKSGWEKMRRMLQDAGKPDKPGLYISRNCEYFWSTVPYLGRDPRNAEDLDTRAADHAADAVRYGVTYEEKKFNIEPLFVNF